MSGAPSGHQLPHSAVRDVCHTLHMCHDDVTLCAHIAPSCVLAMVMIAVDRVCPIASAHDRESGASGSTFERFRRLGVARPRAMVGGARDRDADMLPAKEEYSGMV